LVFMNFTNNLDLICPVPNRIRNPVSCQSGCLPRYIGNMTPQDPSQDLNALVAGDRITSIKQLFNMSMPLALTAAPPSPFVIQPWRIGVARLNTASDTVQFASAFCGDYLCYLAPGYMFARGSVRMTYPSGSTDGTAYTSICRATAGTPLIGGLNVNNNAVIPSRPFLAGADSFISTASPPTWTGPTSASIESRSMMDVIVPPMCITPFYINSASVITVDAVPNPLRSYQPQSAIVNVIKGTSPTRLYRGGADDYCVASFVGFPPLLSGVTHV